MVSLSIGVQRTILQSVYLLPTATAKYVKQNFQEDFSILTIYAYSLTQGAGKKEGIVQKVYQQLNVDRLDKKSIEARVIASNIDQSLCR